MLLVANRRWFLQMVRESAALPMRRLSRELASDSLGQSAQAKRHWVFQGNKCGPADE
jgi:hypothetical protein